MDPETLTTELLREQRELNRRKDKQLLVQLLVIVLLIVGMVAMSLYHDWQWSQFEQVSIDTGEGAANIVGNDNIGGIYNGADHREETEGREVQGYSDSDRRG